VVIFNENLAKVAEQYLRKGSKVYLEGQLQTRKYTDKDGSEKYSTEIVLQRFRGELVMLDSRGGDGDKSDRPVMAGASEGSRSFDRGGGLDDEIPF
jgi:single-strand DNA-binding protein